MIVSLHLAAAILFAAVAAVPPPPARGHVTGLGGVFFKSPDPKALAAWYQDVLGITFESWGGAMLRYDAPGHPHVLVFSPFGAKTTHFEPSQREFMLNFAVDDMDAILARIEAKGVKVLKQEADDTGRFAWIMDPDGVKIELWQPKPHE